MNHQLSMKRSLKMRNALLIFGIIIVAFNLRPAITSVGPLLGFIKDDLQISNSMGGFLTTLPLISFALFSNITPRLSHRFGSELVVFSGLLILMSGIFIRFVSNLTMLLIGTALVGIGIALLNVQLPGLVKEKFPKNVGMMTAIYSTSLGIFAAFGSGASIPLAVNLGLGWEKTLLSSLVLVCIALVIWIPQLRYNKRKIETTKTVATPSSRSIWTSKLAWQVTLFMGLQAFLFYALVAWLPELLHSGGLSISTAGWLVSLMLISGLPGTFFTPMLADRFKQQVWIAVAIGVIYGIGIVGLFFIDYYPFLVVATIFMGLGQGASVSLSLAFLGLRTSNGKQAADLSGMSQSFGYFLAAIGPFLIGFLFDFTQSWNVSLLIILTVCVLMTFVGIGAGKDRTVFSVQKERVSAS